MDNTKSGGVSLTQFLSFENVFPNETPLSPTEYLKGGTREFILSVATFYLGFKTYNSEFDKNEDLLSNIFCKENQHFASNIYKRIQVIERPDEKVGIINAHTSLLFFELVFSMPETETSLSQAELERNLFKAYLSLNSQVIRQQETAYSSTEHLETPFREAIRLLCIHYPLADKMNYEIKEIWACQCFKAIYFFKFLETQTDSQYLLKRFLEYYDRPNWKEYLNSIIALTTSTVNREHESYTNIEIVRDENFDRNCAFFDKLIVEADAGLDEHDFLTLRARPFYKLDEGSYRIIFNLFVAEKIFKGIYFKLRELNDSLPKGQKVKSLKGTIGLEFSEKTLLYNLMDIIYPNPSRKFMGSELDMMVGDGAPDYYVRAGKRILLFESKDFLIKKDLKASHDFEIYEKEFSKTLYYEDLDGGKEKAGAVMQLIGNIRKLLRKEFKADNDYHYKDISIYPIIITHDHQYDVPGLSDLVNHWFQEELEELESEGLYTRNIKPVVIINIDSIIFNQNGLSNAMKLHEVLDAYIHNSKLYAKQRFKSKQEFLDKKMPFSIFMHNTFSRKGIKSPPPLMDFVIPELFETNFFK